MTRRSLAQIRARLAVLLMWLLRSVRAERSLEIKAKLRGIAEVRSVQYGKIVGLILSGSFQAYVPSLRHSDILSSCPCLAIERPFGVESNVGESPIGQQMLGGFRMIQKSLQIEPIIESRNWRDREILPYEVESYQVARASQAGISSCLPARSIVKLLKWAEIEKTLLPWNAHSTIACIFMGL